MSYQFLMGSLGSEMVTLTPILYIESVSEVAGSNATPEIRANITLENYAEKSGDPSITKLIQRAAARSTLYSPKDQAGAMIMASNINRTVSFFSGRVEASAAIGLSCFPGDFYPPTEVRSSQPLQVTGLITTISRNASVSLRQHVSRFYQLVIEMGIYVRFESDTRSMLGSLGHGDQLSWCLSQMVRSRQPDADVQAFGLTFYTDLLVLSLILLSLAACILLVQRLQVRKTGIGSNERRRAWSLE
jgi:hypothetical protein